MGVMGRFAAVAAFVLALVAATALAQPSATSVTAAQLTTTFKRSTGDKLVLNRKMSYPGHYKAYDVGPVSIANKGKYGQFTVYLVTGADLEAEVTDLLADSRTGDARRARRGEDLLGSRARRSTATTTGWRSGATATNVVLWWIGSNPVKKTDRTFKRLHTTLTAATR